MSLINDALKRAKESAPPPLPGQPMQLAPPAPASKLPLILIPILLFVVLGLAVWFLLKGLEVARQVYRSSESAPIAAREPSPAQQAESLTSPDPRASSDQLEAEQPADPAVADAGSAPVPAQPVDPLAELKLNAVFYTPDRPSAVINSKSVEIGSRIGQVTVLSISRETVVVEHGGKIRELSVP